MSHTENSTPEPRISEHFSSCPPEAQLLILSSDNVLFKVNRYYLAAHSAVFSDAGSFPQDSTPVQLTEPSRALEFLFQHMYPLPRQAVDALPVDQVLELAEAAEKYCVYSALDMCRLHFKNILTNTKHDRARHALSILAYATRHNRLDIADAAALATLTAPCSKVVKTLDPTAVMAWMLYKEHFDKILERIINEIPGSFGNQPFTDFEESNKKFFEACPSWIARREQIIDIVKSMPGKLMFSSEGREQLSQALAQKPTGALPPHNKHCYCPLGQDEDYGWKEDSIFTEWKTRKKFSSFFAPSQGSKNS